MVICTKSFTLSTIKSIKQICICSLFSTTILIILWNPTSVLNRKGLHSFNLFKWIAGVNISIVWSGRLNILSALRIVSFRKLFQKRRMRFLICSKFKKKSRRYRTQSQKKKNKKITRLSKILNLKTYHSIYIIKKKKLKKNFLLMCVVTLK